MPRFSQDGRPLRIDTPMPADTLLLAAVSGTEAISSPYAIRLTMLAEAPVKFDDILGQPATVTLAIPGSPARTIRGVLDDVERGDRVSGVAGGDTFIVYRATLKPRLSLLAHSRRSRVWQNVSVPDVLTQVLKAQWGLDVKSELPASPVVRDYVVQYQESDLAFVSRLMEDEGIRYFFDHSADRETIVLIDPAGAPPDLPGGKALAYLPASGGLSADSRVRSLVKRQSITPVHAVAADYSFQKPDADLDGGHGVAPSAKVGSESHTLDRGYTPAGEQLLQVFDYPAGHGRRFDGVSPGGADQPGTVAALFTENTRLAALEAGRAAAQALSLTGTGDVGHLQPGYGVSVAGHFDADGDYELVSVTHEGDSTGAYLAGNGDFRYAASFTLLPASVPFVPQKITPRPRISGVQTARVVGPEGQDIFVDKYGRVKVRFHWDRSDATGPENSCWLRVAQVWAGRRWGSFFWPRVNHEVVVAFEDGDPDRPLVAGSVYNDDNMPPFELPANRVKGGVKSFSASGDSNALCDPLSQFNGLVFHDEKGNEHTELHSERYSYTDSENDAWHSVNGRNRVNVSGVHSHHVGAMPTGSGSGGGDANTSPTFFFNPQTDLDKGWGVNYTSVVGLNHTTTAGVYSSVTVGDLIQIVANPAGLLADSITGIAGMGVIGGLASAAGAVAGGIIGITLGSNTQVSVGTPISITRSGRAPISSSTNFNGAALDGGDKALMVAANVAAYAATVLMAGSAIDVALTNYQDMESVWIGELSAGAALGLAWTEIEVVRAIYQQSKMAAASAAADATLARQLADPTNIGLAAKNLAQVADNLTTLFTNDMTNLNELKYTAGCIGEYSTSRIVGAVDGIQMFTGTGLAPDLQQSVFAMDPENIKLVVGAPLLQPSVLLSQTEVNIAVAPTLVKVAADGFAVTLIPTFALYFTDDGFELQCGTWKLNLSPLTGFSVTGPGGYGLKLGPTGLTIDALSGDLFFDGSLTVSALTLTEDIEGSVTRTVPIAQID